MAVNVKFRANGTFMATRVDDPGAIVVSGNVADVAGRINSLIVRGVLFDGITLGQADVHSILEVDHRVWRNAAWTFKDSRFASRRDAKELFSRPLGRAIAVERCSLADRWDSRWFFSSVAVNSCRTLSIPASIISEGNMPENVDSLVGRLNRTTSGAAQVEPLKLEVHFPLCNAGHRDLFKTLQMRLIQAFMKSYVPCTYEVELLIRNHLGIGFPSTIELAYNNQTGQEFVQHFERVGPPTNRQCSCLWTFRNPESP